jgi:hypothetical protein
LSVLSAIALFPPLVALIVEQRVGDGKPRLLAPGPVHPYRQSQIELAAPLRCICSGSAAKLSE